MASTTTILRGSVRIVPPASPAHALFAMQAEQQRVQVDLYRIEGLQADGRTDADTARAMSMEALMETRIKPFRSVLRATHTGLVKPISSSSGSTERPAQHHYSFSFDSLPAGSYHVLAFTVPPEGDAVGNGSADGAGMVAARYTDPQRQSFGFCSEGAAGGNRWPWTVIRLGGGSAERVLEPFPLRVAHSFAVLRSDSDQSATAVPTRVPHASLRLLPNSTIPVLRLGRCSPKDRGIGHGQLLAPYILDFWRFYLFEFRFGSNALRYDQFVSKWVRPERGFFAYPLASLEEARGVVEGMKRAGVDMFLEEIGRDISVDDILAGYIETRTVVDTEVRRPQQQGAPSSSSSSSDSTAAAPSSAPSDASLAHNCSQAVLWGPLTAASGGSVVAGRNMDGEIDLRKVTATHSILIATDRDPEPEAAAAAAASDASATASRTFRTISLMWPGLVGTLTGVNETGLYLCENAGETQPGTGLVSGLTPVACVQQAALRTLDGRTLTPDGMRHFLERYISRTGWSRDSHTPLSEQQRAEELQKRNLAQYASHTRGGFSGPGSLFVVATPPSKQEVDAAAAAAALSSRSSSSSTDSTTTTTPEAPIHGFVVEADRSHTSLRLPSASLPLDVPCCILATNHALSLGFDDVGVVGAEEERRRAPLAPELKCAALHPAYSAASANERMTNWNLPVAVKSFWRFEAGRNRLQALDRMRRRAQQPADDTAQQKQQALQSMGIDTVRDLLQIMCPGYTEHSFMCELRADGVVRVHVAVAHPHVGRWDAPYAPWHQFDFHDLFQGDLDGDDGHGL